MATEQLHHALQTSFQNPVAEVRKQAEDFVLEASKQPGAVKSFYEISAADHVEPPIRQAAAIRLKYIVGNQDWNADDSKVMEEEKVLLKSTLLATISSSPVGVRKQLLETLKRVISYEFPQKWPSLGEELASFLKSNDVNKMRGALAALRKLTKRYEAWGSQRTQEVNEMARIFYPLLAELFAHINGQSPVQTEEIAEFQKYILKIFHSSNYNWPNEVVKKDGAMLSAWMNCILFVITQEVSSESLEDPSSAAWRAKKWAGYILVNFMTRFAVMGRRKEPSKGFVKLWAAEYKPKFVEASLHLLNKTSQVEDRSKIPGKTLCRFFQIVSVGARTKSSYKVIAPHLDSFLQDTLFPYTCFQEDDLDLWESNAQEYIRKKYSMHSIEEDFANPLSYVLSFLVEITTSTKKFHDRAGITARFLTFLRNVIESTPDLNDVNQMRRRYGALLCITTLRHDDLVQQSFEPLLVSFVYPLFTSRFGFMRQAAVSTTARFAKANWTNPENFKVGLEATLRLMRDPELPVRVESGTVISKMVASDAAMQLVKPVLKELLTATFNLMREIDVEELVQTVDVLIGRFGDDLASESVDLCRTLMGHFMTVVTSRDEDGNIDAEALGAGQACLSAVCTLVRAVVEKGDAVLQLQATCLPLLRELVTLRFFDFFDEALSLVSLLTLHSKAISPEFWSLFDTLQNAFNTFAYDQCESCLAPFDNYISNDPKGFLSVPERVSKLGVFSKRVLEDPDTHDSNAKAIPKLLVSMLQHCKEHHTLLDGSVHQFYDMCLNRLNSKREATGSLKKVLCCVMLEGFYYNTPLTLQYLEARGATAPFLNGCRQLVPKFQNPEELKSVVLGFLSILEARVAGAALPSFFTPEVLSEMANTALVCTVNRYKRCVELEELKKELWENDSDDSVALPLGLSSTNDDEDEDDEDEDGILNEDAALAALCAKARAAESEGLDINDNDFIFDDDDEEEDVSSIIDQVSDATLVKGYLAKWQAADPQSFQQFLGAASQQHMGDLDKAVEFCEKQAAEARENSLKKFL